MNYLLKAIEEYVEKCSVTLKQIRKDIEPIIKELAETDEEYEYMMDTIPHFYRDFYNAKEEHLLMTNNNFEEWRTTGEEDHVTPNKDMLDKKDVLFSIHNHPYGHCLQSDGDWYVNARGRTKYMLSVSKDGIMIVKDNDRNYIPHSSGTRMLYLDWAKNVMDRELSTQKSELIAKIKNKEISKEEANRQMNEIYSNHVMENNLLPTLEHDFKEEIDGDKKYVSSVSYHHDYIIRHIPITKNY